MAKNIQWNIMTEKELTLQIKNEFSIPLMKAKIIAKTCKTYEKSLDYLSKTKPGWCWNILDYRDSEELIELRKIR